jgi:hypothetical protein
MSKHIDELMEKLCAQLAEHVETVQVFVSLHNNATDITTTWEKGIGNRLARNMQVKMWLDSEMVESDYVDEDDDDEELTT